MVVFRIFSALHHESAFESVVSGFEVANTLPRQHLPDFFNHSNLLHLLWL